MVVVYRVVHLPYVNPCVLFVGNFITKSFLWCWTIIKIFVSAVTSKVLQVAYAVLAIGISEVASLK